MLIGHQKQHNLMKTEAKRGVFSHAYLFYGREHLGKLFFAEEMARSILCEKAENLFELCGQCRFCQTYKREQNTQIVYLRSDGREISIDSVRELRKNLNLSRGEKEKLFVIIDHAETLSREAANALLKTLEESIRNTVFFLTASSKESILATIFSRVEKLRFSNVPDEELKKYLPVALKNHQEEVLELSDGRPGIFLRICKEPEYFDRLLAIKKGVRMALKKPELSLSLAEKAADDDELRAFSLEMFFLELRSLLISNSDYDEGARVNLKKNIHKIKSADAIFSLMETTNINKKLAYNVIFK